MGRVETTEFFMTTALKLIEHALSKKATDIHVAAGAPVRFRIRKEVLPISKESLNREQSRALCIELLNNRQRAEFEKRGDLDFMFANEHGRFRINLAQYQNGPGMVIRILPSEAKTIDELYLPDIVREFCRFNKGLILVTGSTSQGKTTTMTAMVDEINTNFRKHIITIEDPIEYLPVNKEGIVRQREVGRDTESFNTGLRAALRQDPDVIEIGEMRDYETIKIALTAAETGVLVLSTLHIISIEKIIERILSYGRNEDEGHMRYLLADSLRAVIHQELVPALNGTKRVACEILVVNDAARNIIRRRGAYMLYDVIATGKKDGMISMETSMQGMVDQGTIHVDVANDVMANY